MERATHLDLVVFALLLSTLFAVFYFASPQYRFIWIYGEVVVDEALLLLLAVVFMILPFNRHLGPALARKVYLPRPAKALALLAVVIGSLLFVFWVMIDLLGGYAGPSYAISTHPAITTILDAIGFGRLSIWDRQGVMGFLSFGVALLGFMALRADHGIGTAVRQGIAFFAAPILVAFELALWYVAPLDMYWHVTTFASWTLGRYLTAAEFSSLMNSSLIFSWAGNVYLVSNWLVLFAAIGLFVLGIHTRRKVSSKLFHRKS
jgi:hypothetical protein